MNRTKEGRHDTLVSTGSRNGYQRSNGASHGRGSQRGVNGSVGGFDQLSTLSKPFDNQSLLDSPTPLKSLKLILKQFEMIEKRYWPYFLKDLNELFKRDSFSKSAMEKSHRVVDDVTRVMSRILTTKLFPDIIAEVVNCLASLARALKSNSRDLFQWIFDFYESASDDTRIVLLKSLVRIVNGKLKGLAENMSSMMVKLKMALECNNSSFVLLELTEIFMAIGASYPSTFQKYFLDVIDILIGWFIDSASDPGMTRKLTKAFIGFNEFFVKDMESSLVLLQNFMEDFEKEHERMNKLRKDDSGLRRTATNKMASLVSMYTTILRSLGVYAYPQRNYMITSNFVNDSLRMVVKTVGQMVEGKEVNERLVTACNECITFTIEIYSDDVSSFYDVFKPDVLEYINTVIYHLDHSDDSFIVSALRLVTTVVKTLGNDVPPELVSKVLSSESKCMQLRYHPVNQVQESLFELHHSFLAVKNVPRLEEAYKFFLIQLQMSFSFILKEPIELVVDIDLDTDNYEFMNEHQALTAFTSTLISLTELSNAKHSLIAMWALKPSFFDLVIVHLSPSLEMLSNKHPDLEYLLLYLLFSHCNQHNHFISSSNIFKNASSQGSCSNDQFNFSSIISPPTTGHLSNILSLLSRVQSIQSLSMPSRSLCTLWFREIIENVGESNMDQFMKDPNLGSLAQITCDLMMMKDENQSLASLQVMRLLMKRQLDTKIIRQISKVCRMKMSSMKEVERKEFTSFFKTLPLGIEADEESDEDPLITDRNTVIRPEDIDLSKEALMRHDPTAFPAWFFKTIINYIIDPRESDEEMLQKLGKMFLSSISESSPLKLPMPVTKAIGGRPSSVFGSERNISDVFQSDRSSLIFWSLWDLVAFCICNKLRTPFGKPQELLTKIQSTLTQVLSGNNLPASRIKMVLSFMEILDKQMTNAIEGGASIRVYNPSKVAKTFFKTNKITCVDWMARNRLTVAKVAEKSSDFGIVWRNATELLQYLLSSKNCSEKDIESVCLLLVENYIKLQDTNSIIGLKVWLKHVHNLEFCWMSASVLESESKYEMAIQKYHQVFEEYENQGMMKNNNNDIDEQRMITKKLIESYLKIDDYENAVKWSTFSGSSLAEKLDKLNLSGASLNNFSGEFDKLMVDTSEIVKNSVQGLKSIVDTTLTPLKSSIVSSKFERINSDLTSLVHNQLILGSPVVDDKLLILLKVTKWLSQDKRERAPFTVPINETSIKKIDPSCFISIIKWTSVLNKSPVDIEVKLNAAMSARKSRNLQLASRLIMECINPETSVSKDSFVTTVEHLNPKEAVDVKIAAEAGQLLFDLGHSQKAIELLSEVGEGDPLEPSSPMNVERSKSLVKLFKITERDSSLLDQKQKTKHFDTFISSSTLRSSRIQHVITCGILESATSLDPENCKSFLSLGNWSYKCFTKGSEESNHDVNEQISLVTLATKSYFTFLQLNQSGPEDENISSCLRLLDIITKNSSELRGILKTGLSTTPTSPWRHIIIQLIAHLSHYSDQQLVSDHILGLLCKIAKDFPHLMVFAAVSKSLPPKDSPSSRLVDRNVLKLSKLTDADLSFDDPDTDRSQNLDHSLQELNGKPSIYSSIVSVLTSVNPSIVSQTIQFITEMRRINVLWDELWIVALMSKLSDVKKKVSLLEDEVSKVCEMSDWSREEKETYISKHHSSSFKKIIDLLRETQAGTINCYPETSHEKWFQSSFGDLIDSTVYSIEHPPDILKPQQILTMYQKLIQELQKRSAEMSNGRSQLVMDTISTVLANMVRTSIPMPGIKKKRVTIEKVSKTVTTLHTKTKPKKVSFHGSNGQLYTFLYKGHEDLHLDERIMQFLDTINGTLRRGKNRIGKHTLRARQYSVTPLGTKSGLIEWVDGPPPLFSFYKRWIKNQHDQNNPNVPHYEAQVKPSEIFNKKLTEKNVVPTSDRKEWPSSILVEIHKELVGETSSKIISRELWMASSISYEFYQMTQTFIRSVAVMSMIGYVLGLGDRHLDNILLDLSSGEVIHVDYNICFEKGKLLRVPERVPFRLTNSILGAFGLTGIEGSFRLTCEHVLSILRREKDTLLLLLEAFRSDPLADWSVYESLSSTTTMTSQNEHKCKSNPYSVRILKKIKFKLEGKDYSASADFNNQHSHQLQCIPVPEQVRIVLNPSDCHLQLLCKYFVTIFILLGRHNH